MSRPREIRRHGFVERKLLAIPGQPDYERTLKLNELCAFATCRLPYDSPVHWILVEDEPYINVERGEDGQFHQKPKINPETVEWGTTLEELLDQAVKEQKEVPPPWWAHHSCGRIRLVGPWKFREGVKWQAISEPYNSDGSHSNSDIEAIGSTPTEAVRNLITTLRGLK